MRSEHAYRADVVGSLLRPPYLKEARERHAGGALSDAELKRVEDRAVDEAVALQARTGVAVVTDGEMRRYAYFGHFIDALEGFDKFGGWAIPFRDEAGNELLFQRAVVVSRLRRRRHLCAEEFTYLRARADRPSPRVPHLTTGIRHVRNTRTVAISYRTDRLTGQLETRHALVTIYGCPSCHVIPDAAPQGMVGPTLTSMGRRSYIAGRFPNHEIWMTLWLKEPQQLKPGSAMPNLGVGERDARDMAAYLAKLR